MSHLRASVERWCRDTLTPRCHCPSPSTEPSVECPVPAHRSRAERIQEAAL